MDVEPGVDRCRGRSVETGVDLRGPGLNYLGGDRASARHPVRSRSLTLLAPPSRRRIDPIKVASRQVGCSMTSLRQSASSLDQPSGVAPSECYFPQRTLPLEIWRWRGVRFGLCASENGLSDFHPSLPFAAPQVRAGRRWSPFEFLVGKMVRILVGISGDSEPSSSGDKALEPIPFTRSSAASATDLSRVHDRFFRPIQPDGASSGAGLIAPGNTVASRTAKPGRPLSDPSRLAGHAGRRRRARHEGLR